MHWPRHIRLRHYLLALQFVVSMGLLAWLFSHYYNDLADVISRLPVFSLVAATLVLATSQIWGGLRLWILTRAAGDGLSWLAAIRLTFAGFFAGSFLPSTVGGDLLRGLVMTRHRVAAGEAAILLLVDRILNTFIVLVAGAVSVPVAFGIAWLSKYEIVLVSGLPVLIFAVMIMAPKAARLVEAAISGKSGRLLTGLGRALKVLPKRSAILTPAIILSFASLGASLLAQYMLVVDLGISISPVELTAVICLVYLVTLLPISLNGLGLQEASITALLVSLGTQPAVALTLALAVRIIMIAVAALGAIAMLGIWSAAEPLDKKASMPPPQKKNRSKGSP